MILIDCDLIMATGETTVALDKIFSKWIIRNLGENKTADFYAHTMINMRIKNGWITPRKWTETVYNGSNANEVQWITANTVNNTLLVVQNGHLRKINIWSDPVTDTDIGDISYSGKVRFIEYGKYTIILTWSGYPWVYDNSTLSQLTSSNIAADTNPSFWVKYAGFTVVNSSLNENAIVISVPITLANQEKSYDWASSGKEDITFASKVLWMTSTINFLRIFTERSIEYISRDNLTTTWWVSSLYTIPIAQWDVLMNPDTVTNANEYIFYMTASRKIKTINYVQGNPVPQVATISEEIDEFMQNKLNSDQTNAFASFDKVENLVKFHVRSRTWSSNDMVIIRDLENETRFVDMDKYYLWIAELGEKYYAWSALSYRIVQDEKGVDDDDDPVQFEYLSTTISLWDPVMQKQFRWAKIGGKINWYAKFEWTIYVDDVSSMSKQIDGSTIPWNSSPLSLWIGWSPIGAQPIGWNIFEESEEMSDFEREATRLSLRASGQKVRIGIKWWQNNQKMIVDYAEITLRPRKRSSIASRV